MDVALVQTVLSILGMASIENRRTLLILVVTVNLRFNHGLSPPFVNVFDAFNLVKVETVLYVQGLMPSVISRGNNVSWSHVLILYKCINVNNPCTMLIFQMKPFFVLLELIAPFTSR